MQFKNGFNFGGKLCFGGSAKANTKKGYMCEKMPKNLSYDTKVTYSASPRSSASM
jgi:hypothetical protein